jgi:hypothetical protein
MSLVLLAIDGEEELKLWQDKLSTAIDERDNITMYGSCFYEPYWNDRLTAVVAYGDEVKNLVKELQLL